MSFLFFYLRENSRRDKTGEYKAYPSPIKIPVADGQTQRTSKMKTQAPNNTKI